MCSKMFEEKCPTWHTHVDGSSSDVFSRVVLTMVQQQRLLKELFLRKVQQVSSTPEMTGTFCKAPIQWTEPGMRWAFVVQRERLSGRVWLLTPSLNVIKESHKKEVSTLLSLPGRQTWFFPRSLLVQNYAALKAARHFGCPSTCLPCSCHYLCFTLPGT